MAETMNKRDQVKALITLGTMTKIEMAAELDMSVGSCSTQMTYLRWMDNYIFTHPETKIISFITKEEADAIEAAKPAKGSSKKASTRTPAERAVAVAKTIATQETALGKWNAKVVELEEVLEAVPDDADAILNMKEAVAQVALHEVKLERNEALAADLPDLEDAQAEVEAAAAEKAADTAVAEVEDDSDVEASDESTDELL
jgi:hypothetical protein